VTRATSSSNDSPLVMDLPFAGEASKSSPKDLPPRVLGLITTVVRTGTFSYGGKPAPEVLQPASSCIVSPSVAALGNLSRRPAHKAMDDAHIDVEESHANLTGWDRPTPVMSRPSK
jgi:hypothetical protein